MPHARPATLRLVAAAALAGLLAACGGTASMTATHRPSPPSPQWRARAASRPTCASSSGPRTSRRPGWTARASPRRRPTARARPTASTPASRARPAASSSTCSRTRTRHRRRRRSRPPPPRGPRARRSSSGTFSESAVRDRRRGRVPHRPPGAPRPVACRAERHEHRDRPRDAGPARDRAGRQRRSPAGSIGRAPPDRPAHAQRRNHGHPAHRPRRPVLAGRRARRPRVPRRAHARRTPTTASTSRRARSSPRSTPTSRRPAATSRSS